MSKVYPPNSSGQYNIEVPKSYTDEYTYTEGQITKIGTSDTQTVDDFLAGKPFPSEVEPEVVSEEVVSGGQFGDIPQDQLDFYEEIGYGIGDADDPSTRQDTTPLSNIGLVGDGDATTDAIIEDTTRTPNMANKKLTNVKKVDGGYSKEVITTDPNRPMGSPITTTYFIPDDVVVSSSQGKSLGSAAFETDITVPESFEYGSTYNPGQEQISGGSGYQAEREPTITDIDTGETTLVGDAVGGGAGDAVGGEDAAINEIIENVGDSANVGGTKLSSESTDDADLVVDAAEETAKTRAGVKRVYDQLGVGASEEDINFHTNIYGPGGLNFSDQKDLTEQLRGNQLNRFETALGLPKTDYAPGKLQPRDTLKYDFFNADPVQKGRMATAGIDRLLPDVANRGNTFYSLAQDPTFATPDYEQSFGRQVEKARATNELGEEIEGGGKSLFPLFQDVFGQDYKQGIRDDLAKELTPGIRAQVEAEVAAEQAAAEGGMYAGGLATLSEANIFNKGGEVDNMGLQGLGQKMAAYGRYGDTMLAHISPEEAKMLKAMGGSGTRNPVTGLPEFFIGKLFKGLFKGVKKIAPFVLPFIPGFQGLTLGKQALLAGGIGGLSGDGKFDLKRALTSGLTTYGVGSLAKAANTPIGPESGGVSSAATADPSRLSYQPVKSGVVTSTSGMPATVPPPTSNYTGVNQTTAGASTAPSGFWSRLQTGYKR